MQRSKIKSTIKKLKIYKFFGIFLAVFLYVFFFNGVVSTVYATTDYVANPTLCPTSAESVQPGVSCAGANQEVCGTSSSQIYCYDTSTLSTATNSTSTTSYGSSFDANGGYVVDCYSKANSTAPYCTNSGSFWCNKKTSCSDINRQTQCSAGKWSSDGSSAATCVSGTVGTTTGCVSGYYDCVDDGNGSQSACLDSIGSTFRRNAITHATYGGSCSSVTCNSGYIDCTDSGNNPANGTTGCTDVTTSTGYTNAQYVTGSTGYGSGGQCGVSCQSGYLSCNSTGSATSPATSGDFDGAGCNIQQNTTVVSGTYDGATFSDSTVLHGSTCSTFTCASGHLDCNGATLGANVAGTNGTVDSGKGSDGSCEQTTSGDASSLHGSNTQYVSSSGSCQVECKSGYYNQDGDIANGCEVQSGVTSCDPGGGQSGTWECTSSSCTCTAATVVNFQTGIQAAYKTASTLLNGVQQGTGDLLSLTSSTVSTAILKFTSGGLLGIGTATPSATLDVQSNSGNASAILTLGNTGGSLHMFRVDATPEGSLTGSVGDIAVDTTNGLVYVKNSGSGNTGWVSLTSSTSYFAQNNGLIYPNNSTQDFALGGISTASAKFAVLGMSTGTPTASLSAGLSGGLYMTAAGAIATTNGQSLTLGNGSTGNVVVNPSRNVGIGTTTPTTRLDIKDTAANGTTTNTLRLFQPGAGGGTGAGIEMGYADNSTSVAKIAGFYDGTGRALAFYTGADTISTYTERVRIASNGNVGIGTTNPSSLFSVGSSSQFQVNSSGAIAAATGITSSGTITLSGLNTAGALLYTNGSGLVSNTAQGVSGQCLISNGSGIPTWTSCSAASNNYFNQASGLTYLGNTTSDFAIGGTATTSAAFAVLNMASGTPTATVSGNFIVMPNNGAGGKVGIGTIAPSTVLDVQGATNANASGAIAGMSLSSSVTGRNNSSDSYYGIKLTPTFIAGANTQTMTGLYVAPTYNDNSKSGVLHYDAMFNGGGDVLIGTNTNHGATTNEKLAIEDTNTAGAVNIDFRNNAFSTTNNEVRLRFYPWNANVDNNSAYISAIETNGASGATDLAFGVHLGAEAMRLKSDGKVGIGTSSPLAMLDVNGSASISGSLTFQNGSSSIQTTANNTLVLGGNTTGDMQFKPGNASNSLYLSSTGNVGIGSTTPGYQLDVIGAGHFNTSSAQPIVMDTNGATGTNSEISLRSNNVEKWEVGKNSVDGFFIWDSAAGRNDFGMISSGNMYLMPTSGNVGVGTQSPASLLHVSDSGRSASGKSLVTLDQYESQDIFTASASGSTKFVINNSGNVGIGTGSPTHPLHIVSSTNQVETLNSSSTSGTWLQMINSSSGGATWEFISTGSSNGEGAGKLLISNGTPQVTVDSSGRLGVGTVSPASLLHVSDSGKTAIGKSLTILDQYENQDILAASASGSTKLELSNAGQLTVGNNAYDTSGDLSVRGNGRNMLILQTSDNTLDRGLSFRNAAGSYSNSMYVADAGSNNGDLRFGCGTTSGSITGLNDCMTINYTGNVGIGTTSAQQKLQVYNPSSQASVLAQDGAGQYTQLMADSSTSAIIFKDSGTFRIQSISTPQSSYPGGGEFVINGSTGDIDLGSIVSLSYAKVTVGADANKEGAILGLDYYGTGGTGDAGLSFVPGTNKGSITMDDSQSGKMFFSMGDPSTLANRESNAKMTIQQNGHIGIATTSADEQLTVGGNVNQQGMDIITSAGDPYLRFKDYNGGTLATKGDIYWNRSGNFIGISSSTTNIDLGVGGGNVGIGQSSPGVKLHVGSTSVTDGTNLLELQDTNSNCTFSANSGTGSCTSDQTLKTDINSLNTADLLTRVTGLRPVSYHWKTDDANAPLNFGFIAQEVEQEFPDLVSEHTWTDGSTKKFLNIGGLMPYVVGAMKEQQLEISSISAGLKITSLGDASESLLASLNDQIASVSARVTILENRQDQVLGKATKVTSPDALVTYADLTPLEAANYKMWQIAENIVFTGEVSFANTTRFLSDAIFKGSVTLNNDTVGSVTIPVNATKVRVIFSTPFAQTPVVNLTQVQTLAGGYTITDVSTKGFTISLAQAQTQTVVFNWTAFMGEGNKPTIEVLETITPSIQIHLTPTLTPVGATPVPTLTPTVKISIPSATPQSTASTSAILSPQ